MKISVVKNEKSCELDYIPKVSFYDLESKGLSDLKLGQVVSVVLTGSISRISQSADDSCLEVEYKEIDVKTSDSKMSDFVSEIEDD